MNGEKTSLKKERTESWGNFFPVLNSKLNLHKYFKGRMRVENGNWQNDKISWLKFDRKIRVPLSDAKESNVYIAHEA